MTTDGREAHAFVRYERKTSRATLTPAGTVNPQLHREGYYRPSRVAMHKPLMMKMTAHLRVQFSGAKLQALVYRDVEKNDIIISFAMFSVQV